MKISLNVDEIRATMHAAPTACAYWQADANEAEKLPGSYVLTKILNKPLTVTPDHLRIISNQDSSSVDCLVQIAMFGEMRFG